MIYVTFDTGLVYIQCALMCVFYPQTDTISGSHDLTVHMPYSVDHAVTPRIIYDCSDTQTVKMVYLSFTARAPVLCTLEFSPVPDLFLANSVTEITGLQF